MEVVGVEERLRAGGREADRVWTGGLGWRIVMSSSRGVDGSHGVWMAVGGCEHVRPFNQESNSFVVGSCMHELFGSSGSSKVRYSSAGGLLSNRARGERRGADTAARIGCCSVGCKRPATRRLPNLTLGT